MTIRPHDTEQILDTLGEAIERLRLKHVPEGGPVVSPFSVMTEIANSLALLHGAVEAEAKKADKAMERVGEDAVMARWFHQFFGQPTSPMPPGAVPKPIDVKPSPGHRARYLGGTVTGDDARIRFSRADKHERIADEVSRGEHDDER